MGRTLPPKCHAGVAGLIWVQNENEAEVNTCSSPPSAAIFAVAGNAGLSTMLSRAF